MKTNNPTIIECTDTHIKLVQMKSSRHQPSVTYCEVRALHEYSDAELTSQIVTLTRLKNIQSDQIVLVIPRRFVILKFMHLPSLNLAEVKKMAGLQLVNQIPYSLEDVVYDCEIVEQEKSGYSRVLVIIVHKDVFNRYAQIFNKAGLPLSRAVLSSFGISGWMNYQFLKEKINPSEISAVINMDLVSSEVCFCENQKLIFSRQINYGSKDLGADNFAALLNQIELSIKAFQNETKKGNVARFYIISSLAEAGMLRSRLESDTKVPVRLFSGFENIFTDKKVDVASIKSQQGVSLTVPLGLALLDGKSNINLAPQEIQEKKRTSLRKFEWIKFALLFLGICVLLVSIPGRVYYHQQKILKNLEEKVKAQEAQVKTAEQKLDLIKSIQKAVDERIIIAEIFYEINRLASEEISLRSINLDEKGMLAIQGYAQTSAGVNNFQAALVNSPVFKELNLEFATKRKIFNVDVVDFKIVAQLKDKIKKDKVK